jgi:hypothetical protein
MGRDDVGGGEGREEAAERESDMLGNTDAGADEERAEEDAAERAAEDMRPACERTGENRYRAHAGEDAALHAGDVAPAFASKSWPRATLT